MSTNTELHGLSTRGPVPSVDGVRWRLLAEVPDEHVELLLRVARRCRFARGQVVFHHDDPADSLHLISSGRFAVRMTSPVGSTFTLALLGPGDNFGEMALVSDQPRRSATVRALEPAETYAIHHLDFDELRRQHPSIDRVLVAFLVGEVRALNRHLVEALFVPAERRIMGRLVELAPLYASSADSPIELPLTQEDLATFVGTSRATVNQVLRQEERRGTVELRRGKTVLLDIEALRMRAC